MADDNNKRHVDFRTIRAELVGSRALYADPDFRPDNQSLYINGHGETFKWTRAGDLFKNPYFQSKGVQRHDIDQGKLGNCWFIAAASSLAVGHKKLFDRVVPPDQDFDQNYAGIFHFNFWWYGKWREVVVDDYLPTDRNNRLVYCKNRERPNELWPPLLEKAYAKLRGSYEVLDGGKLQDAMVDLTGGISEVIDLRDKGSIPADLYTLLRQSYGMKSLQGCCIFRPDESTMSEVELTNGLFMGHAYSITRFQQLKTSTGIVRLLRLRNPWGHGEWKGAWSDSSKEMTYLPENIRDEMRIRNRDEGEFWISYEDFLRNFDEIQLCHLQVDAMVDELEDNLTKQSWNVTVYHDEWIRGVTAGGCGNSPNQRLYWNNPQFYVELKKADTVHSHSGDCTIVVSLMEKEKNKSAVAIGFDIYKLKQPDHRPLNERRAPKNALLLAKRSGTYVHYREITRRFELPPGDYVVVPSTFNPHEEAKFMLRIFTEKFADSSVLEEEEPEVPTVLSPKDFSKDIFHKLCGSDSKLDASELQKFLTVISEEDIRQKMNFSLEQCRSLLPLMDENGTGRLEFHEAKRLWRDIKAYREVFIQFDADRSNAVDTFELTNMFQKLGFPVSRPVLTSIVRRYGDRNNRISLEDFVVAIIRLTQLFDVYLKQESKSGRTGVAEFSRNEFLQQTMYL